MRAAEVSVPVFRAARAAPLENRFWKLRDEAIGLSRPAGSPKLILEERMRLGASVLRAIEGLMIIIGRESFMSGGSELMMFNA